MKIILLFTILLLGVSCSDNKELNEIETIDPIVNELELNTYNYKEAYIDPYQHIDFSIRTEKDIDNWLDSTEYIGINDFGYRIFDTIFSCQEAKVFANNYNHNSEKALYAFYKLTFGDCRITTEEAILLIESFESCTDTLKVWMSHQERGDITLAEEAADAIWQNTLFPMTPEQDKQVAEIRNL